MEREIRDSGNFLQHFNGLESYTFLKFQRFFNNSKILHLASEEFNNFLHKTFKLYGMIKLLDYESKKQRVKNQLPAFE